VAAFAVARENWDGSTLSEAAQECQNDKADDGPAGGC